MLRRVSVKYHGKPSHGGAYPWGRVNALDAAAALQQPLRIITHGGEKPNIIPAYTGLEFCLRTPLVKDLRDLKAKAEACFGGAAVPTGCQMHFNHTEEHTEAAGAETAQLYTLRTAKARATTAVDVVCCPDRLRKVREDFGLAKLKQEK
ncbi:unnamed protein product [Pleuronectes platessa]|uniref:Peptidase M20 dimerisation domain-containing protein n=1 Tax=Pleuronectes platessa TaxID=8262 RepID=A0A9N7UI22_PLEPL|nr:unnamed protein product [Pleuronectes platessa]